MLICEQPVVAYSSPIELGEERRKPFGMLIIDGQPSIARTDGLQCQGLIPLWGQATSEGTSRQGKEGTASRP